MFKQLFITPIVLGIYFICFILDGLKNLFKGIGDYLIDIAIK